MCIYIRGSKTKSHSGKENFMQAEQSALQQLSFQKDIAKPFELLQLEVLEKRTNLSTDDKKLLWVQRMGYQGERIFFEFITRYAKQHWKVLYRTWLSVNGRLECDFIIMTRVGVYFFEIKHYNGSFVYENHQQFINQRRFKGDILGQFKQMKERTSQMCHVLNYSGLITHKLIYINPYYTARLPQEWEGFLLHYNQLNDFFEKITRDENTINPANLSPENFDLLIDRDFRCEAPYQFQEISAAQATSLKTGIECVHCGSFSLTTTRYKVICSNCHQEEFKEEAGMRMIEDFRLLFPNTEIIGSKMALINGGFFHHNYLNKILYHARLLPHQ